MKKRIIILFLGLGIAFYGFTAWEEKGVTVVSSSLESGRNIAILRDKNGNFSVSYTGQISNTIENRILALRSQILQWKNIEIKEMQFTVTNNEIEILLYPAKVIYNQIDMTNSLVSGMFFFYQEDLSYDFRMVKDNKFMKIKGKFTSEEELLKKMLFAIQNPTLYIKQNTMDYALSKLEEQENEIEKLKNSIENLRKEFFTTRYALVSLSNRGFFGGLKPIPVATIEKIVALKKKNPTWKIKDIENQLSKENISISSKEIGLVIGVFFNEFED